MLVTKSAKTATIISKLSPTYFVSNIRCQHRCSRWRYKIKNSNPENKFWSKIWEIIKKSKHKKHPTIAKIDSHVDENGQLVVDCPDLWAGNSNALSGHFKGLYLSMMPNVGGPKAWKWSVRSKVNGLEPNFSHSTKSGRSFSTLSISYFSLFWPSTSSLWTV